MGLIRFAIKSSIVGGLVYYTVEEGLWSNAEESAKFYNKLRHNINSLIEQNVPQDVKQEIHRIPTPSDISTQTRSYVNKAVIANIAFLSDLPTHVSNGIKKIQKEVEKVNLTGVAEPAPATASK